MTLTFEDVTRLPAVSDEARELLKEVGRRSDNNRNFKAGAARSYSEYSNPKINRIACELVDAKFASTSNCRLEVRVELTALGAALAAWLCS